MRNKFILIIFGIFLISFCFAQPPTFHQFYGDVLNEDGFNVETDISISAYISGNLVQMNNNENGVYGYDDLFIVENADDGDIVNLYVDNYFSVGYVFSNEEITRLDLVLNTSATKYCIDADADGYNITGGSCGAVDCDDARAGVHPGATENCDTAYDDNCDGSINEGCESSSTSSTSSTSSGGGTRSFEVIPVQISTVVKQGETKDVQFTVKNTGEANLSMNISSNLNDMILYGGDFNLGVDETKTVIVKISVPEGKNPDLYLRHITLSTVGAPDQEVVLSIEVISNKSLFDISVRVIDDDLYLLPGQEFDVEIALTRIVITQDNNIVLHYVIKDGEENIVFSQDETRTVETENTFVKTFTLPAEVESGDYIFYVQVDYQDNIASASQWFKIESDDLMVFLKKNFIIIVIAFVSIVAIVVIGIVIINRRKFVVEVHTPTQAQNTSFSPSSLGSSQP